MKPLSDNSLLSRGLGWLAAAIFRYPRWFIYPQVGLFLACVVYAKIYLKTDMNRANLVGANQKYHQNFLALQKEFPQQGNDLVVVVESDSLEKNRQFTERIATKMAAETNLFRDVFYQKSLSVMGASALLFADEQELAGLKGKLEETLPFIRRFTPTTNLVSFFEQVNTAFRTAPRETNAQTKSLIQALPALTRIVTEAVASLQRSGTPPSPSVATLFNAGSETNLYLTFGGGRIFLVRSHAPSKALIETAIQRLRQLIQETQDEVPGLNVGLIGEPVLDYDETLQSQKDIEVATVISLVLCVLIFIYGYNETGRPVKATICLVVGMAYTLAFAALTIGHLNVLTLPFVPMLIGLAIDYGVHLITRYEEELRHGRTEEAAMTKALVFTGQGIFTGALTTAGAFFAMAFTDFRGIQELGVICGGGLVICLVPMMTLLPALLLRGRQNVIDHQASEDLARARIENIWLQRPVWVIAIIGVLCLLAFGQARKVYFDYNLQKLQSIGLPSVVFEHKLLDADQSLLYCAILATNLDQAVALGERIRKLPTVAKVEPPNRLFECFLRPGSEEKVRLIGQIKQELAPLQFGTPDPRPVDIPALSRTLFGLYGYLGLAREAIGDREPELAEVLAALREAVETLRKTMLHDDTNVLAARAIKLAQYQQALFNDLGATFLLLQNQDTATILRVEDLPRAFRDQFVGVTGKFLLHVFPRENMWQREHQETFISELRTVDPNVTGSPVQLYEYEELLKNSYLQAAWYSLTAIALLVLFHFRSLGAVILALLPVGVGTLWLAGLMGWLGIPVNLANIMTLPLVIGIGVTNGIHILNRYAEERTPGILSRSTGKAVLVSGLTAIAGFGSLIIAKYRGIHSLGCVMSVGIATCMVAGLTLVPALLSLLGRWRPLIKRPSAGNSPPTLGQEEPR